MNLDVVIPLTIGGLLLALGSLNELLWHLRLWRHVKIDGRVVDLHADGDGGCFPEVEFEINGMKKQFWSAYSIGRTPFIGESVVVVADCHGENAERLTTGTRWCFTAIPIAAGAVAIGIALV